MEAALREDRNHNGIPDALERPPVGSAPGRTSIEDIFVVGTIAVALLIGGAVIVHYAMRPPTRPVPSAPSKP